MKPKSAQRVTLATAASSGVLTILAITLTIASLSWQGLIEMKPRYKAAPDNVRCVVEVNRREGFFHVCHAVKAPSPDDASGPYKCRPIDYGSGSSMADGTDKAYLEIIGLRRSSLVSVMIGLILAVTGLALLLIFYRKWSLLYCTADFKPYQQLLVGSAMVFAGLSQQFGTVILHMLYMRDKVLHSDKLALMYSYWPEAIQRITGINYSHSYYMLITSAFVLEIAGVLIFFGAFFAYLICVNRSENDMGHMTKTEETKARLPRFDVDAGALDEQDYDNY